MTPRARLLSAPVLLALLVGCGGDAEPAPAPAAPEERTEAEGEESVVAALGDSIIAGSPLYDPDPARRDALGFGDDERSQLGYWAELEDPALEVRNCGVFGERVEQIAARLDECAEGAGTLLVQGGINDIAQALGGGPNAAIAAVDRAADGIDALVAAGQQRGLDVAVANVLPWNNGFPVAQVPIAALNDAIAKIARERDVPLLDFHDALEDPQSPGLMAPELTDDGDHPSIEGYRILGELAAAELGA